jgi:hypothetical protein
MKPGTLMLVVLTLLLGRVEHARAGYVTVTGSNVGSYYAGGFYSSDSTYVAGIISPAPNTQGQVEDYFVFDLTSVTDYVTSAKLVLYNPDGGYASPNPTQDFSVTGISVPIPDLLAHTSNYFGSIGVLDPHNSLYYGVYYGSTSMSTADNGQFVTIDLAGQAIVGLNAARGEKIALGGEVTDLHQVWLGNRYSDDPVFLGASDPALTSLVITTSQTPPTSPATVPGPANLTMLGVASVTLAGYFLCRRRKQPVIA